MLALEGEISREISLSESPEKVADFVRGNEGLLYRILGRERVDPVGPALYRFRLYQLGALGVSLRPAFDMLFERSGDLLLKMTTVGFSFLEGSHRDMAMDAKVWARAALEAIPEGTLALVQASVRVSMEVPAVLRLVPRRMLEIAGNALLDTTMRSFADRALPIVKSELEAVR